MKWTSYGPNAWLLTFAEQVGDEAFARGQGILAEVQRRPPPGLAEVVPAFTTMLFEFDSSLLKDSDAMLAELTARFEAAFAESLTPTTPKEIPVIYDGPDLERVARLHDLTVSEVCRLHSETVYNVYLLGFAPGFPYLGELNPRLHTPRLASPRPRVAAGSVAIGGEHTGVYSVDSPGGWNVVGRTSAKLFDPARGDGEEMFHLQRGDRVRFVPEKRA